MGVLQAVWVLDPQHASPFSPDQHMALDALVSQRGARSA